MYRTATVNLSDDLATADPIYGTNELGELSGEQIIELLEKFRALDVMQNHHAEPHLVLNGRSGRMIVRTGQGKLYLYNARETIEPYAELSPAEIVAQLDRTALTVAPWAQAQTSSDVPVAKAPPRPAPHKGIAAAILIAGVALNGYTLYSVFYTDSVNDQPAATLLAEGPELAARRNEVIGTFATGSAQGDRVIVVASDGTIRFNEIGSKLVSSRNHDVYRIGRRAARYCLTTAESGTVDIVDADTLSYFRDTYRRVRQ